MGISEMLRDAEPRAQGEATLMERQAMLVQHAGRVAESMQTQQAHLAAVHDKIEAYRESIKADRVA